MYDHHTNQVADMETTCGLLLLELQKIWDEVGESDVERDKMLYEIEQECLEVYRRKVAEANRCRSELQRAITDAEAEIKRICLALDEQPLNYKQKDGANLKEEFQNVIIRLEEMRKRKAERREQFVELLEELENISNEIFGSEGDHLCKMVGDGTDLSMKNFEELKNQLHEFKNEKSNRLKQVLSYLNTLSSLCGVLGMDFKGTIYEISPNLDDTKEVKDITDDTMQRLVVMIESLQELKLQRLQMLQDLAAALLELWNLMDTPVEEQSMFQNVTSNIAASEAEINEPNMLSMDFLNHVEEEVLRLEQLKSSKVKELILKKRLELEEICRKTHMVPDTLSIGKFLIESEDSVAEDPVDLLEEIELEIAKVKEEAINRKEILEKVEKWLAACDEECWLEEYNRDDNRYNAGRGAHLTLKRAEKARAAIAKIPAMVEALSSRVIAWETECGVQFLYDGEPLFSRLEEYSKLRQEKEQEKQRQREQKKLQVQLLAEEEALFGSKLSPSKSGRKAPRTPMGVASDRKLSLGGAMLQNFKTEKASPRVQPNKRAGSLNQNNYSSYQQRGARRNSENAGELKKQSSTNTVKAHEKESCLVRKPLSTVSSTVSSKANIVNLLEDEKRNQNGILETTLPYNKTPKQMAAKSAFVGDKENRTPKTLTIPVPTTPPTVSAPMLMAATPATPYISSGIAAAKRLVDQVEYSFEELRAGFVYLNA